jgi:hypothetical protein
MEGNKVGGWRGFEAICREMDANGEVGVQLRVQEIIGCA